MKNNEKIIKIGDIIVIAVLLAVSLMIFLSSLPHRNGKVTQAVVSVNGEVYGRYALDVDREITVSQNGHVNIIEIKNGSVRVKSADCPNKSCVRQGFITKGGEVIVCLPAHLTVTLENAEEQVDTVAY